MQSPMMEVRCCCQPKKLMGYLPVDSETLRGDKNQRVFQKKSVLRQEWLRGGNVLLTTYDTVTLPIAQIVLEDGSSHFAIKAEGMKLEELRELVGFQEVKR